jgi:hypothetical protein
MKILQSKKALRVDGEIPMELRCCNSIHRNFLGDIPLIQMTSLEKILWIWILQFLYKYFNLKKSFYVCVPIYWDFLCHIRVQVEPSDFE